MGGVADTFRRLGDDQKAFRDFMYGTQDQPNQTAIDQLNLSHAVPENGADAGTLQLVPWRDQVIDVNRLSPSELQAIGLGLR